MRSGSAASRPFRLQVFALLGAVALAPLSGCYKATFIRNPSAISGGVQHEEWTDFFIFGLVGNEVFDVRKICGNADPALVGTGGNLGTSLIGVLTIGIYTPRKIYVVCGGPERAGVAYHIETNQRGEPRRLVRRARSGTQQAPMLATGPSRWSARLLEGEVR